MRMTSTMATMMGHRNRAAFTLVELLMAMTITLLLMAALGKSFAVIGKTMKEGRSQVSLSSKLRGVSFRLRTDLRSMTIKAQPPLKSQSGGGYFTYYEGPLTEHTFGLYGAKPFQETTTGSVVGFGDPGYGNIDNGPTYREHSRQGDFDDYIAFTAEAPGDDWFTGKVPAYLVDDTVDVNGNGTLDPAEQVAAMEPRVIRSKYAEIIIWASPDYQVWDVDPNAAGTYPDTNDIRLADHPLAMPLYADSDQDYVPDRIRLHQRILLIRPDLNSRLRVGTGASAFESPLLRPLLNDTVNPGLVPTALQRIYPIGNTLYPNYAHPTSATDNRFLLQSNWLVGMAPLHHFFDLSLRRVFHPQTGDPTNYVAANSLEDLVQPHNRFAHVRYPGRYFGRGTFGTVNSASDNATSLPLVALGWNDTILNWQGTADTREEVATATAPAWFPTSHPSPNTLNSGSGTRHGLFNGWLLPHFELGNPGPKNTLEGTLWQREYLAAEDPRWDRTGEDVVASNVVAFDVKGFDNSAPVFLTPGPDGEPGKAGVNDDDVGGNDDTGYSAAFGISSELGAIGSDDLTLGVGDLGMYDLFGRGILSPPDATGAPGTGADGNFFSLAGRGDFVDAFYPYLAGSPFRDRMNNTGFLATPSFGTAGAIVANTNTNYDSFLLSEMSGLEIQHVTLSAIKRSGKLVHSNATGAICFFQPTYDTWTDAYETDGFDQSQTSNGRTLFRVIGAGAGTEPAATGSTWVLNNVSGLNVTPRILSGSTAERNFQVDSGRYDSSQPESSPPIPYDLPAVEVTVRVMDPATHEMTQFTVVEGLQ